jgi:hypothetical protein
MTDKIQIVALHADGNHSRPAAHSLVGSASAICSCFLALLLIAFAPAAVGQALPAAEAAPISTGFALPRTAGTLRYAVSASESLTWGYYGLPGTASSTNLSGDIAYISVSQRDPFSMVFSGGRSWSTSGQPSYSFLDLGLSQVANFGRWNFVVSDSVSYLPSTPTGGLSGVAGVGDLGLNPVPVGTETGQGVLTNFSSRVVNAAAGTIQRQLTGKTSLNASGSSGITHFLNNSVNGTSLGLDSNYETGGGGISHQVDVRNSFGGNYAYSSYSYSGSNAGVAGTGFVSQTASLQFSHQFTRKLGLTASGGPQFTTVNLSGSGASLSLFVNALASYAGQFSRAGLAFSRGTNSGYGVIGGSISNSVQFSGTRTFGRVWGTAVTSAFTQTSSLPGAGAGAGQYSFHTTLFGVQVSRAIARSLSAYTSYTLQNQSGQGSATVVDVYSGFSQVLGFGLTYSPTAIHVGRP